MIEIIIFFVIILLGFLGGGVRPRRSYRRLSMLTDSYYDNFYSDYDYNTTYTTSNDFTDWIRSSARRRKALKYCRKFLKKTGDVYKLQNDYVIIKFYSKAKILNCVDKSNFNNSVNVIWANQKEAYSDKIDNEFEEFFDTLCVSFDEYSQYSKIKEAVTEFFEDAQVSEDKKFPKSYVQDSQPEKTIKDFVYIEDYADYKDKEAKRNKININDADEKYIVGLPGVSVALAKKIIKYRDLNGGFKSLSEFYNEMKIKPHFQKQLNDLIYVEETKVKEVSKDAPNERIIDF